MGLLPANKTLLLLLKQREETYKISRAIGMCKVPKAHWACGNNGLCSAVVPECHGTGDILFCPESCQMKLLIEN